MKNLYHLFSIGFACFLLSFATIASGQVLNADTLYYYHTPQQDAGYDIHLQDDGSFMIFNNSSRFFVGTSHGYDFLSFMNVSADGKTMLSQKALEDTLSPRLLNIVESGRVKRLTGSDAHGYLVPLTIGIYDTSRGIGLNVAAAGLLLLDYKGDTVFMKNYFQRDSAYNDLGLDCDSLPSGGFIIAGNRTDTNNENKHYGLIVKTDSRGNLLWSKKYETFIGDNNNLTSIQYVGNGKILAGGSYSIDIGTINELIPWFLLVDTMGNIIKSQSAIRTYAAKRAGGGNIFRDIKGGYYHFGTIDSAQDYVNSRNPLNNIPYIAHINDSLQQDWIAEVLDTAVWCYPNGAKQLKNGDYIIYGQAFSFSKKIDGGWICKINSRGNVLWSHYYQKYMWGNITSGTESKNGSLAFIGFALDSVSSKEEVWFLGVDSNGIGNGMYLLASNVIRPEDIINLYPNPASNMVNVDASADGYLKLFSISGELIFTSSIKKGKNHINLYSIADGTYFAKIMDNQQKVLKTIQFVYRK